MTDDCQLANRIIEIVADRDRLTRQVRALEAQLVEAAVQDRQSIRRAYRTGYRAGYYAGKRGQEQASNPDRYARGWVKDRLQEGTQRAA